MKDYYRILGVPANADSETIASAYKTLAKQLHPDLTNGDAMRADRFRDVNDAYDTLSIPDRRQAYDRARQAQRRQLRTMIGLGLGLGALSSLVVIVLSGLVLPIADVTRERDKAEVSHREPVKPALGRGNAIEQRDTAHSSNGAPVPDKSQPAPSQRGAELARPSHSNTRETVLTQMQSSPAGHAGVTAADSPEEELAPVAGTPDVIAGISQSSQPVTLAAVPLAGPETQIAAVPPPRENLSTTDESPQTPVWTEDEAPLEGPPTPDRVVRPKPIEAGEDRGAVRLPGGKLAFADAEPSHDVLSRSHALHLIESRYLSADKADVRKVADRYCARVDYWGEPGTPRASVVRQIRRFAWRWPRRAYRLRPDTLQLSRRGAAGAYRLIFDYDFKVLSRPKPRRTLTRGIGRADLMLRRVGGRWRICREDGRIVKRQVSVVYAEGHAGHGPEFAQHGQSARSMAGHEDVGLELRRAFNTD